MPATAVTDVISPCVNRRLFSLFLDSYLTRADAAAMCPNRIGTTATTGSNASLAIVNSSAEWDQVLQMAKAVSLSAADCLLHGSGSGQRLAAEHICTCNATIIDIARYAS
jgi:hypothetical protein